MTAIALWEAYGENPLAADEKYKDKLIQVSGSGRVHQSRKDERYYIGFEVVALPAMTQSQLARLSARERAWFKAGAYPPNVVAYLNSEGVKTAAKLKSGQELNVTGLVKGSRKADVWRDYAVIIENATVTIADKKP